MTDRLKGVFVTFDRDIREDDAEHILNAIRMVKHVVDVQPLVSDHVDEMARSRVDQEWREKLWELMEPRKRNG